MAQLRISRVLVKGIEGKRPSFGTAFHLRSLGEFSYYLTCAHVVAKPGILQSTITVDGQAATIEAIEKGSPSVRDLAILRTRRIDTIEPDLGFITEPGYSVTTRGAQEYRQTETVKFVRCNARISDLSEASQNGVDRAMQLDLSTIGDDWLNDGFSGSPIVLSATGTVVGVVCTCYDEGRKGTAVSIKELENMNPPLQDDLRKSLRLFEVPFSSKQEKCIAERQQYIDDLQHYNQVPYMQGTFIPMSCRALNSLHRPTGSEVDAQEFFLARFCTSAQGENVGGNRIVLLADFGGGKSCLCRSLLQRFGNLCKGHPERPLPILCHLSEFSRFAGKGNVFETTINKYILGQVRKITPGITADQLSLLLEQGNIIWLLDGFDEMPGDDSAETLQECLRAINTLREFGQERNLVLLTSRKTFFATRAEQLRLHGFAPYEICPWGENEWQIAVRLYNAQAYAGALAKIPELQLWYRKPYFVSLLLQQAETLAARAEVSQKALVATDVYSEFVQQTLAREFAKSRGPLNEQKLRNVLQETAWRMINTYELQMTRDEIVAVIRECAGQVLKPAEIDNEDSLSEMGKQVCHNSLLHKIDDRLFAFPHTSMTEYLCAELLASATSRRDFGRFGTRVYYGEIFEFAALLHASPQLIDNLLGFMELSPSEAAALLQGTGGEVETGVEHMFANLMALFRVMNVFKLINDQQLKRYAASLIKYLGFHDVKLLQVRYVAAFSLWTCKFAPDFIGQILAAYEREPFGLIRRTLWCTLRYFADGQTVPLQIPNCPDSDAFDDTIVPAYFARHPSAIDALLRAILVADNEVAEVPGFWIVIAAGYYALTSNGERRIIPALIRDSESPNPLLAAEARHCLTYFADRHVALRPDLKDAIKRFRQDSPTLSSPTISILEKIEQSGG